MTETKRSRRASSNLARYRIQHLRALASVERQVEPIFRKALQRVFEAAASAIESGYPIDTALSLHAGIISDAEFDTTSLIVPVFYDRGIVAVGADIKAERATAIQRLISGWMQQHGSSQITLITETTRSQIVRVIESGALAGEGARQIASNIRKLGSPAISLVRARRIARTETHNAAMYANQEAARSTGLELLKKWVSTEDSRVRPSHAAVDSQGFIPIDEHYIVGGKKMIRPADPAGGVAEIINCRCGEVYKPVNSAFDDE